MLIEIHRTLEEIFFLRTDPSEMEHLAIGGGGLAMLRMVTVHAEELVCVHGYDMQVSLNLVKKQVILQCDQSKSIYRLIQ